MCLNCRTAGIQMPFLLRLFPSELRCFQNTWTRTITLGAETACLHLILQMKCREYPHPSKPVGCLSVSSAPVLTGHSDIPRLSFTGFLSWQEEQLYKAFCFQDSMRSSPSVGSVHADAYPSTRRNGFPQVKGPSLLRPEHCNHSAGGLQGRIRSRVLYMGMDAAAQATGQVQHRRAAQE